MIKILKAAIAPFYSAVHTCPRNARKTSYYPDANEGIGAYAAACVGAS